MMNLWEYQVQCLQMIMLKIRKGQEHSILGTVQLQVAVTEQFAKIELILQIVLILTILQMYFVYQQLEVEYPF